VRSKEKSALLKKVPLPSTGRYVIRMTRKAGQGEYKFTIKEKLPLAARKLRITKQDEVVLGPDDAEFSIELKARMLVSGSLKAKPKDGMQLLIKALTGPNGEPLLSMDEAGVVQADGDAMELVKLGKELVSIRLRKFPISRFGTHTLRIGAVDGTSGQVTGTLTFKLPREKQVFEDL